MNSFDHALFLLAKRYHARRDNKGTIDNWYGIRKVFSKRQYVCHICKGAICLESRDSPRKFETEEALKEHGRQHLVERGLEDFV